MKTLVMFLSVLGLSACCLSGWKSWNSKCYKLSDQQMDWSSAIDYCKDKGGNLIEVRNAEDQLGVIMALHQCYVDKVYWTGMYHSDEDGTWVYASTGTPITFTQWSPGEPNGYRTKMRSGLCIRMYNGCMKRWDDHPCYKAFYALCEKADD